MVCIGPEDEDGLEVPPVWGGVTQRVTGNLGSAVAAESPEQCAGVLRGLRDGERGGLHPLGRLAADSTESDTTKTGSSEGSVLDVGSPSPSGSLSGSWKVSGALISMV